MSDIIWADIVRRAVTIAKTNKIGKDYENRLRYEITEIIKQGAQSYWIDLVNSDHQYDTNNNGLVLPWLLGMTTVDPMSSEHEVIQQTDWPDIDLDCLPYARDSIKEYVIETYGEDKVCSVGAWQTYKFKLALQDVTRALGGDMAEIIAITKELPNDVDDLRDGGYSICSSCEHRHNEVKCLKCNNSDTEEITIGKILSEHEQLEQYSQQYPDRVNRACEMVGKIKALSKHAGGVIISGVPIRGKIPLTKSGGQWTSMWSEGRNPVLSKYGFIKWDVLGLKTLGYIHKCCQLINQTRGYKFDTTPWGRMDPEESCAGIYEDGEGNEQIVSMDDQEVFEMINDLRTETIFQFETDVQRGVLKNGVRDFYDLQVMNAMGHPGPIECIAPYSKIHTDCGLVNISDLDNAIHAIEYLDQDGEVSHTNNYESFSTGNNPLYKLQLANGNELCMTGNQEVLTDSGYVRLDELTNNDEVYCGAED